MTATLTPAELAEKLGTDSKTCRKFLRSITPKDEQPGKGGRWSIDGTKRSVTSLGKQFRTWDAAEKAARAERTEKAAQEANAAAETTEGDDSEVEELED